MVSDHRLAGLKSYQKYGLRLVSGENGSNDVYVIATPRPGMENIFNIEPDSEYAKVNLSSHVGFDQRTSRLVWGQSGFHHAASHYEIWENSSTKERFLKVQPLGENEDGHKYISKDETRDETRDKPESSHAMDQIGEQKPEQGIEQEAPQPDSSLQPNPQKSEQKNKKEQNWPGLNLDEYLDIIEEHDSSSREVKLRLGPKPDTSKRSIILCFDGTSNHFSNRNTNIVKLVELLKKDDPLNQLTGVGTYSHPGLLTGISVTVAAKIDEGVAWYLYQHVIDGYKYLMETYRAGDQISIFGFSRGAYTARALAGMLHSVGLLPRHNLEQVPFAYQVYESSEEDKTFAQGARNKIILGAVDAGAEQDQSVNESARPENVTPEYFKMTFCTPVQIAFLGVWDTVGSVGTFSRKSLPWIEYNPSVKHFRQALALDESRGNFIPSLWDHLRAQRASVPGESRTAMEVWFKGGHSDIGGGAPLVESDWVSDMPILGRCLRACQGFSWRVRLILHLNGLLPAYVRPEGSKPFALGLGGRWRSPDLSNISLRWMVRQCLSRPEAHILFDPYSMHRYRKARILEERPQEASRAQLNKNREKLDDFDVTKRPYIAQNKMPLWWRWWFLECMPVPKLAQRGPMGSRPKTVYCPNLGTARSVNGQEGAKIFLHYSVYAHIKRNQVDKIQDYRPAAEWYNWPEDEWPQLEDIPLHMSSVILKTDADSKPVRERLKMTRDRSFVNLIRDLMENSVVLITGHALMAGAIFELMIMANVLPPSSHTRLVESMIRFLDSISKRGNMLGRDTLGIFASK